MMYSVVQYGLSFLKLIDLNYQFYSFKPLCNMVFARTFKSKPSNFNSNTYFISKLFTLTPSPGLVVLLPQNELQICL